MAAGSREDWVLATSLDPSLCPVMTTLKAHWPSFCPQTVPGAFLGQGLYTCPSTCLQCCPVDTRMAPAFCITQVSGPHSPPRRSLGLQDQGITALPYVPLFDCLYRRQQWLKLHAIKEINEANSLIY